MSSGDKEDDDNDHGDSSSHSEDEIWLTQRSPRDDDDDDDDDEAVDGSAPPPKTAEKESGKPETILYPSQQPFITSVERHTTTTTRCSDPEGDHEHSTPTTAAADSSSSSSSEDDDDPLEPQQQLQQEWSLSERRLHNIKRNHRLLERLGLAHGLSLLPRRDHDENNETSHTTNVKRRKVRPTDPLCPNPKSSFGSCRGILLPGALLRSTTTTTTTPNNHKALVDALETRYPGRTTQIRQLVAALSTTTTTTHTTTAVPSVVFVTGGPGTGKTSVVRDVVAAVVAAEDGGYHAYLDCATLDAPTMEELVGSAFRQFEAQQQQQQQQQATAAATNSRSCSTQKKRGREGEPREGERLEPDDDEPRVGSSSSSCRSVEEHHHHPTMEDGDNNNNNNNNNNHLAPSFLFSQQHQPNWTAVAMLGRALERLFLRQRQQQQQHDDDNNNNQRRSCAGGSAIWVLDHAERLLNLPTTNNKVNFLAQLLLLPRLCRHLSIVVVTRSVLLEHTCLNHMSSQGTIASHIAPLRVHFASYRGKNTIQTILYQDRMRSLITGETLANQGTTATATATTSSSAFADKVYHSFIGTLVQSLQDLTTDIKEFVRLGRALWPQYTSLVRPTNIRKTLDHVQRSNKRNFSTTTATTTTTTTSTTGNDTAALERDILSYLDQKIFPYVRYAIEHGLGNLMFDRPTHIPKTKPGAVQDTTSATSSDHTIPVLARYLLLAAYVCQVNRAERDKQLFTIETNGKSRRRRGHSVSRHTEEEAAMGCTASLSLRARTTYPAERLYSLYVSMVSLNHHAPVRMFTSTVSSGDWTDDHDDVEAVRSLGNIYFLEAVAHLQSLGILHDFPQRSPNDAIRLSQRSFWSSITRDEAQQVAKSVKFPLDRYIL